MRPPLTSRLLCLAVLGLALGALRCGSSDGGSRSAPGGGSGGSDAPPRDKFQLDLGGGGTGGGGQNALHPLCLTASSDSCLPDDPEACGTTGQAGAAGLDMGFGGMGGMGGEPGAGGTSVGTGGAAPGGDEACHLALEDGMVVRACEPAGGGALDAPCLSPANCAPGLTCVGEGASGLCRPYCCAGACSVGTYCVARQVVGSSDDLQAPVCVQADQCKLSDEYPCPPRTSCQCGEGTACVPVRSDGTTSCVVPGSGGKGDACDSPFSCSYGYVCSQSRGCLELCSTVSTRTQCGEGEFCQALAGFPDDVGVCISAR